MLTRLMQFSVPTCAAGAPVVPGTTYIWGEHSIADPPPALIRWTDRPVQIGIGGNLEEEVALDTDRVPTVKLKGVSKDSRIGYFFTGPFERPDAVIVCSPGFNLDVCGGRVYVGISTLPPSALGHRRNA